MSGRSLRSVIGQARKGGRHRRLRSLERRAGGWDATQARLLKDVREIKAALLVMGAPIEGEIPAELTCAIISGCGGQVTLDLGGMPVIASLDPGQPGDVVEIWKAIKDRVGTQAAS
jgi:hypothetical protein